MIRTYSQLKHVLFKTEKCSYFPEVACICETVSDVLDEVGVLSIFSKFILSLDARHRPQMPHK